MEKAKRRGRPRTFNEDELLDRLLGLFWTRGYSGSALDDLAETAGVNRASLYVAFGSKEGMYLRALDRFAVGLDEALARAMLQASIGKGLSAFYLASLDQYLSGDVPRGCLVLCTAPVEAVTNPTIKERLAAVLKRLDVQIADYLRRCDPGLSEPASLLGAQMAASILHSLALRARAGEPPAQLWAFASNAAANIEKLLRDTD